MDAGLMQNEIVQIPAPHGRFRRHSPSLYIPGIALATTTTKTVTVALPRAVVEAPDTTSSNGLYADGRDLVTRLVERVIEYIDGAEEMIGVFIDPLEDAGS